MVLQPRRARKRVSSSTTKTSGNASRELIPPSPSCVSHPPHPLLHAPFPSPRLSPHASRSCSLSRLQFFTRPYIINDHRTVNATVHRGIVTCYTTYSKINGRLTACVKMNGRLTACATLDGRLTSSNCTTIWSATVIDSIQP